eukprot:PhF_6_TR20015/c0_g1_i1/m.29233
MSQANMLTRKTAKKNLATMPTRHDWKVNPDALEALRKQTCIQPPQKFKKLQGDGLMYFRKIERQAAKGSPVRRILLLTKHSMFICTEDGEVKRMIPILAISELRRGFSVHHDEQLLVVVPADYDVLLTFYDDRSLMTKSTREEFIACLQLVTQAFLSRQIPVSEDIQEGKLKESAVLEKPPDYENLKARKTRIEQLNADHIPSPQEIDAFCRTCMDASFMMSSQTVTLDDVPVTSTMKLGPGGKVPFGGMQYQPLLPYKDSFVSTPAAPQAPELVMPNSVSEVSRNLPLPSFPTSVKQQSLFPPSQKSDVTETNNNTPNNSYGSVFVPSTSYTEDEVNALRVQLDTERRILQRVRNQTRCERMLAQMVTAICYQAMRRNMAKLELDYEGVLREQHSSLQMASSRVEELEKVVHRSNAHSMGMKTPSLSPEATEEKKSIPGPVPTPAAPVVVPEPSVPKQVEQVFRHYLSPEKLALLSTL